MLGNPRLKEINMGGNIFKEKARRLDGKEYHELSSEVLDKLQSALTSKEGRISVPKHIPSKSSFGDIDFITDQKFSKQQIKQLFMISNGEVRDDKNFINQCVKLRHSWRGLRI